MMYLLFVYCFVLSENEEKGPDELALRVENQSKKSAS